MLNKLKSYLKSSPILWKLSLLLLSPKRFFSLFPSKKIKGKGNIITIHPSAKLYNCKFEIIGNNNRINIGKDVIAHHLRFYLLGNSHFIHIEANVQFNRSGVIWLEDDNCKVKVGSQSTFEEVHIAATEPKSNITIGRDCMFATGIEVRTGDSHSLLDNTTGNRINYAKDVVIGDRVWVASNVSLLKGSEILSNSVVATRAVVVSKFNEPNILIAGIPAKKIKDNINWDRKRLYGRN